MGETVMLTVANAGYDFHGCDSRHSDNCACVTWEPQMCPMCEERIEAGQDIYVVIRERFPYLAEDDEEQDWEVIEWHKACDRGSVAADAACPHDSLSGDEGPISELGRFPTRWRCEECGDVVPWATTSGDPPWLERDEGGSGATSRRLT